MKDIFEECHLRVLIEVVLFDVERFRSRIERFRKDCLFMKHVNEIKLFQF